MAASASSGVRALCSMIATRSLIYSSVRFVVLFIVEILSRSFSLSTISILGQASGDGGEKEQFIFPTRLCQVCVDANSYIQIGVNPLI